MSSDRPSDPRVAVLDLIGGRLRDAVGGRALIEVEQARLGMWAELHRSGTERPAP